MTWLLWRQHRAQTLIIAAITAAFAIAVFVTGVHMAHLYDDSHRQCVANGTCDFVGNIFSGYGAIIDTVHLSLIVPLVFGVIGAVIIAREVEQSTNVLVWTQTVTRRRWLWSKVVALLLATLVVSTIITALVTWWSGTPNALYGNRFEGAEFDTQNIVPIAFALFAVALGLTAGALWRRTLPAIATVVGVYIGVRMLVAVFLRPHYMKAVTRLYALSSPSPVPSGSWTMRQTIADASGHATNGRIPVPAGCDPGSKRGALDCLHRSGFQQIVKYQPASRYWHFQWAEAVIYLLLAAMLVTIAVTYTLRRDA
jgi:hypothetical protein